MTAQWLVSATAEKLRDLDEILEETPQFFHAVITRCQTCQRQNAAAGIVPKIEADAAAIVPIDDQEQKCSRVFNGLCRHLTVILAF